MRLEVPTLLAPLLALSCGPLEGSPGSGASTMNDSGDDGSGDAGSDDGTAETGATHPTQCNPDAIESTSPFDPDDCSTYEREEPSVEMPVVTLTVRIVNASDTARTLVPLGTLQPARYHELVGSVGTLDVIDPASRCPTHFADYHCDGSLLEDLCADLVIAHDSITLAPGAAFEQTWNPWVVFEMLLPPCIGWVQTEVPCAIPRFARPGDYAIEVRSAPADACADCCIPAPGEACESEGQPTSSVETTAVPWDGVCESVEVVLR